MEPGKTVFSVKDMVYVDQFGKTRLDHVSFSIKEGQILGSQESTETVSQSSWKPLSEP